ncbi:MAG TPA: sporulation protein [Desulfotomaculum sp.]|nr:MAG: hypothetical protein VR67_08000 [Peptococcaceae bacterium BRH_c8a]KJS78645.1 MAG: hypothetical protein JL56_01075 [Desulfotomaculum sp. BICA1-6]HBX22129.1 sporulation protein [Desulfotomaculum sp.]
MKLLTRLTLTVFLMLIMSGCTMQNSPAQKPQPQQPQTQQQQTLNQDVLENTALAAQVKERAKTVDAVEDSVVVVLDREISVAAKVTGFDRLRLKSIRQEVHQEITRLAPEYKVYVTTDKKLFAELQKLNTQIQQGEEPAKLKTKFEKINKNMRG